MIQQAKLLLKLVKTLLKIKSSTLVNMVSVGSPFIPLHEVDSTNNYAMARIAEGGVKEGTAWFANHQTRGRGQRGKSWHAAAGDNINLSLVLQPVMLKPSQSFILSALIALAVDDFMRQYAGVESSIKWSNDIYWRDKKAGGILIENLIRGQTWTHAVVGIGLNINPLSFPKELPNPISLRQITGRPWESALLAKELCQYVGNRYTSLEPSHSQDIIEAYESRLFRLRQPALYRMGDTTFEGTIQGVESDGRLILQRGTQLLRLRFGEIQFVV